MISSVNETIGAHDGAVTAIVIASLTPISVTAPRAAPSRLPGRRRATSVHRPDVGRQPVRADQHHLQAQSQVAGLADGMAQGAVLVAFPELGLSAYTCDDLFHQSALLEACEVALAVRAVSP